jgi:hypothetical protein
MVMPTVELNMDRESKTALNLLHLIAENDPDLLREFLDGLFESLKISKSLPCDGDGLPATAADASLAFLKLGNEFVCRVTALGARYRERGFVVPRSFNHGHGNYPVRA